MKKLFLSLALFAFLAGGLRAQDVSFGLKGGLNIVTLNDFDNGDGYLGFHAGPFIGVKSGKLGFQADLMWSRVGDSNDSRQADLDYLMVPVVMKVYLIKGLNIQGGLYAAYLLNDNLEGAGFSIDGGQGSVGITAQDYSESLSDLDYGLTFGLGWDLPVVPITLEARYALGLGDNLQRETIEEEWKTRTIQLSLGINFK